jgi:predicted amidophosphoribosyltransferase
MHVHSFIEEDDEIYFFYEYTAFQHTDGQGYHFSPGNDLIGNLKKDVVKFASRPDVMAYKWQAVRQCAEMISYGLSPQWLTAAVLTPIPPSKAPDDPAYDDRMLKVASAVQILEVPPRPAEVRELIRQTASLKKSHESAAGARTSVDELLHVYAFNEAVAAPSPSRIAIIDDMLTTGRHFRAIKQILAARFPTAQIIGVFITRRVIPEGADFDALVRAS